jgi:hypothetical protein
MHELYIFTYKKYETLYTLFATQVTSLMKTPVHSTTELILNSNFN